MENSTEQPDFSTAGAAADPPVDLEVLVCKAGCNSEGVCSKLIQCSSCAFGSLCKYLSFFF